MNYLPSRQLLKAVVTICCWQEYLLECSALKATQLCAHRSAFEHPYHSYFQRRTWLDPSFLYEKTGHHFIFHLWSGNLWDFEIYYCSSRHHLIRRLCLSKVPQLSIYHIVRCKQWNLNTESRIIPLSFGDKSSLEIHKHWMDQRQ